jgi:hypothetical protein
MKRGDEAVVMSKHFTQVLSLDAGLPDPPDAEVNGTKVVLLGAVPSLHGRRWRCASEDRDRFLDVHEDALHLLREGTDEEALIAETETAIVGPIMRS